MEFKAIHENSNNTTVVPDSWYKPGPKWSAAVFSRGNGLWQKFTTSLLWSSKSAKTHHKRKKQLATSDFLNKSGLKICRQISFAIQCKKPSYPAVNSPAATSLLLSLWQQNEIARIRWRRDCIELENKTCHKSLKQFRGLDQHPTNPSLCRKAFKKNITKTSFFGTSPTCQFAAMFTLPPFELGFCHENLQNLCFPYFPMSSI